MFESLNKDEILRNKVLEVADYVILTGASTRETSQYFTENRYPISNATVHTYLTKRLKAIDPIKYQQVQDILAGNLPKTVQDKEVQVRIYQAVSLLIDGYTVPDIARELHSTVDIIYDDLTTRIRKMNVDEEMLEKISFRLEENRLANLQHYKGKR